jgi:hypothetical protein
LGPVVTVWGVALLGKCLTAKLMKPAMVKRKVQAEVFILSEAVLELWSDRTV